MPKLGLASVEQKFIRAANDVKLNRRPSTLGRYWRYSTEIVINSYYLDVVNLQNILCSSLKRSCRTLMKLTPCFIPEWGKLQTMPFYPKQKKLSKEFGDPTTYIVFGGFPPCWHQATQRCYGTYFRVRPHATFTYRRDGRFCPTLDTDSRYWH